MGMTTFQRRIGQASIVCFIAFEVYVACLGIEVYFGTSIAAAAILFSLVFRFGVTFVIGAFLCAYFVWDWPIRLAALFSAPALILMFPHLLADALGMKASKA